MLLLTKVSAAIICVYASSSPILTDISTAASLGDTDTLGVPVYGVNSGWLDKPRMKKLIILDIDQTILHTITCYHKDLCKVVESEILHVIHTTLLDNLNHYFIYRPGFIEYLISDKSRDADYALYTAGTLEYGLNIKDNIEHLVNKDTDVLNQFKFKIVLSSRDETGHEIFRKGIDPILVELKQLFKDTKGDNEFWYDEIMVYDDNFRRWGKSGKKNNVMEDIYRKKGKLEYIQVKKFQVWRDPADIDTGIIPQAYYLAITEVLFKEEMKYAIDKYCEDEKTLKPLF